MKLTVAICDNDRTLCGMFRDIILEQRPDYHIDIYLSGDELLYADKRYDLIFLDIEMPNKNGMCIAKELRDNNYAGHIIFLTSHAEYMPDAFKVRAFRFLQKPINLEYLRETLREAEKEIFEEQKLVVTDYGFEQMIHVSDILYIETNRNRTTLHLISQVIETNNTLKFWLRELGNMNFFQVHKSYVVSLRHIEKMGDGSVVLRHSGEEIPVSRRNFVALKKAFHEYILANAKTI